MRIKNKIAALIASVLLMFGITATSAVASSYTPWSVSGECFGNPCENHNDSVIVQPGDVVHMSIFCNVDSGPSDLYQSGLWVTVVRQTGSIFYSQAIVNPGSVNITDHSQPFNNAQTVRVKFYANSDDPTIGCLWKVWIN